MSDVRHPLLQVVRDRRFWAGPGPLVVLLLVLANVATAHHSRALREERQSSLLLAGRELRPGVVPRYDWSVGEELARYLPFLPDARKSRLVIITGMSQMYAINDSQPGDLTISEHLDDALAPQGTRVFGLAAPNLHNEEALLLLLAALASEHGRPHALVYGVCFDKFRNVDLRPRLMDLLRSRPDLQSAMRGACADRAKRYPLACAKIDQTLSSLAPAQGKEEEPQDLESRLRGAAAILPLVASRQDLNAAVQTGAFLFRNWLFHITPTSKRSVIASRYQLNQQLLELMLDAARASGVTPYLYVIPLNPRSENPYVPEEYAAFKAWLEELARARGVAFANLEDVVPSEHWGEFMGGPDFKHFREEGHRRTAAAILEAFGPSLAGAAQAGREP